WALVTRYDGEFLQLAAQYNARPEGESVVERLFPCRPGRDLASGRAILEHAVVHIPDARQDADLAADASGIARSFLAVPLIRDGMPIGTITASRSKAGPFVAEQIPLLQTFADQAVIAIENVRLFTELQQKNEALTQAHARATEALEQQTATAEILRVISQAQTDAQPVFQIIAARARRLSDAAYAQVQLYDGEQI